MVLHWLDEVHAQGSLDAYLASLLEDPAAASPFVTLSERARAAARAGHVGEPRAQIREAERRAIMDVTFLLLLVLELERVTSETIHDGTLRLTALRWELRARIAEGGGDRRGRAAWRTAVLDLATELARGGIARRLLEARYLDGRAALSPSTLAACDALSEGLAGLVSTMGTLSAGRRRRRPDDDAIRVAAERTAPDEADALAERVRARVLDLLGDHVGAAAIAERGLRPGG